LLLIAVWNSVKQYLLSKIPSVIINSRRIKVPPVV